jgi:FkbM family methyltransferase
MVKESIIITSATGRKYHVEKGDGFYTQRLASAGYQVNNLRYFRSCTKNARTIIDVGGHLGTNTIEYATWAKSVKTFEPTSYLREWLLKNIELNKVKNSSPKGWYAIDKKKKIYADLTLTGDIEVFPYALSDVEGRATIIDHNKSSGHNHLELDFNGKKLTKKGWIKKAASRSKRTAPQFVYTKTLDSFEFKDVDGIKIDVEGLEFQVIKGGLETIKKYRPVIQTEIQENMCRRAGYEANDLCKFMADLGYKQSLSDGTIVEASKFVETKGKIDRFWLPA